MDEVAILIPAYEPDEKLVELVTRLRETFAHVVVVDDGSRGGRDVFAAVADQVDAVLVHPANRGKGAALRTGLAWIQSHLPRIRAVVTADADGQHLPQDILRVAEATAGYPDGLVLGVREFSGSVPFRSRLGNWWARVFFRILTGLSVRDTQTGLRGIPRNLFARLLALEGDRYEYEMRMLVDARNHVAPPLQLSIETVYLAGNRSSHFHPLRDTIRTECALFSAWWKTRS